MIELTPFWFGAMIIGSGLAGMALTMLVVAFTFDRNSDS